MVVKRSELGGKRRCWLSGGKVRDEKLKHKNKQGLKIPNDILFWILHCTILKSKLTIVYAININGLWY